MWPLAGRDVELDVLTRAVTADSPRSVVLVGPAGIGKTRLAREAMRVASAAGYECLWVTATPSVARTPFGAFAPLLSAADSAQSIGRPDTFDELLRRSARALLENRRGNRLILFVDDAHTLDDASAGLIQQLVSAARVRVVVTLRTGETMPSAVTALWKDDLAIRLRLNDLSVEVIDELLTAVLQGQVDRAAVTSLGTRCQGNVLFLRELVHGALSDGSLVRDGGVWRLTKTPAPSERIVEVVGTRLAGLSQEARELLELVAYGEPLGSAEVQGLADERLVDELHRQGLLVVTVEGLAVSALPGPGMSEVTGPTSVRFEPSEDRMPELVGSTPDTPGMA